MAIYGRFGDPVTLVRRAKLGDVERLEKRKVDKSDLECFRSGSYVIVRYSNGREGLYHLTYLRADGGSLEISKALEEAQEAYFQTLPKEIDISGR